MGGHIGNVMLAASRGAFRFAVLCVLGPSKRSSWGRPLTPRGKRGWFDSVSHGERRVMFVFAQTTVSYKEIGINGLFRLGKELYAPYRALHSMYY